MMKKSIIALAVAAGSLAGVAQADGTTLYGSVRMAYTYAGSDKVDGVESKSSSMFANNGSRFGIKGSDDLGNGLTAFYNYENRIQTGGGLNTNKLYLGLKGDFGTVSFGKQNTPRDNLSNFSDPSHVFEAGYGRNAMTDSDNSAAYISPDMSGFSFAAAVVSNGYAPGVQNYNRHVDAYDLLAQYDANGFYAGLGYQAANIDKKTYGTKAKWSNLGLGLGYGNDTFEVGFLAEQEKAKNSSGAKTIKPLFVRLGGTYNLTPSDAVYASVSHYDSDVDGAKKVKGAMIGFKHQFSKRTKVWAEYGYRSKGLVVDVLGATGTNYEKSNSKFGVGLQTDF